MNCARWGAARIDIHPGLQLNVLAYLDRARGITTIPADRVNPDKMIGIGRVEHENGVAVLADRNCRGVDVGVGEAECLFLKDSPR